MLKAALERNRELVRKTQGAACGILKVGRIVLLGAVGPLRSSPPFVCFRLLDLPSELVQLVLSLIYMGALSDRQFSSVIQHAADRTTLLSRIVASHRTLSQAKLEFWEETGCDCYDR